MKSLFLTLPAVAAILLTGSFANGQSCQSSQHSFVSAPATAVVADDIVDTAVSAGKFNTLAAALKAAGLIDTLKSKGPFTVFAPTDDAFKKLPKEAVANLLKPENKDQLIAVLTYHVVPGRVSASQVMGLDSAKTVQGSEVSVSASNGKVKINDATVIKADIDCSNGIIHVIDTVILPPKKGATKDIVETAVSAGKFKTLAAALTEAGLIEVLQGDGPFTVFAPTDEAFAALPEGTVAELLKPENKQKLASILTYHVVKGRVMASDVVNLDKAKTVQGSEIAISTKNGKVMIDKATVIKADIPCKNGVIHIIDRVITPSS